MRHRMMVGALGASLLSGLVACAHAAGIPEGVPTTSTSVGDAPPEARWTAQIAPVIQDRLGERDIRPDKSYGSVEWTQGIGPNLSTVNLQFTYTGPEHDLSWAVVLGRCGAAALPLMPLSNFPELVVGGAGRTQVTATLPVELPTSGAYHVDIYRDRMGGDASIVGCGNLKYAAR